MALARDDSPHWVHASVEIQFTLNALCKSRTPLTCEAGDPGNAFTTEILAADASGGLILDTPPLQTQMAETLRSTLLTLRTAAGGVRIEFELERVSPTNWEGGPALRAPLPKRILKIQRRNFFRITIPKSRPIACVITAPGAEPFSYPILDIGLGGVALLSKEREPPLEIGKTYEKCKISLPELSTIEPRVLVRHVADIPSKIGPTAQRYGCEFVDLRGPQEALIQRFVLQLERDRRAADLVDS